MNTVNPISILCAAGLFVWCGDSIAAPAIRLNSVGFLPGQPKQATLTNDATRFTLVRSADGAQVFTGAVAGPVTNADTRERLFTADFSAFTNAGTVQLDVPGAGRVGMCQRW